MNKKLQYLVSVQVSVTDGEKCFGADIGEGIQIGINKAMDEGLLTSEVNEHTLIESVATEYQEGGALDSEAKLAFQQLVAKVKSVNALQHAGIKISSDDWSDLHQMTNKAEEILSDGYLPSSKNAPAMA